MSASELKVAEKWDTALEKGIKRTAYGAIAGGVIAALLFRTYCLPFSITAISWSTPYILSRPDHVIAGDALFRDFLLACRRRSWYPIGDHRAGGWHWDWCDVF